MNVGFYLALSVLISSYFNQHRARETNSEKTEQIAGGCFLIRKSSYFNLSLGVEFAALSLVFFGQASTMTKWTLLFAGLRKMMIPPFRIEKCAGCPPAGMLYANRVLFRFFCLSVRPLRAESLTMNSD